MSLGSRIQERRTELKLSLRELADRVDLTASFLSQIERDLVSPSIDSLRKISEAMHVPVFYFLMENNGKCPLVRHDRRLKLTLPDSQQSYELLTPHLGGRMEAFLAQRLPGQDRPLTPLGQYTEEFIYVLEGQLEIQLGEDCYLLEAGDTAYFEGPTLRKLSAKGDSPARFISVMTPPAF